MKVTFPENNNTIIIRIPKSWSFDYFKTMISESIANENNTLHIDNNSVRKMKETLLVLFRDRTIYLKSEGLLKSSPTNIESGMVFSFKTCSCNVSDNHLVIVDNQMVQRDLSNKDLTSVIFLHKNNYIKLDFVVSNTHSSGRQMVIVNVSTLKEISSLRSEVNIMLNDDTIFINEPMSFGRNPQSLNDETIFAQPCSPINRNLNNPPPREYLLSSKSSHVFAGLNQRRLFSPLGCSDNGENGQLSMILGQLNTMSLEIRQLENDINLLRGRLNEIVYHLNNK